MPLHTSLRIQSRAWLFCLITSLSMSAVAYAQKYSQTNRCPTFRT
jgi:hypothetical protein